MGPIILLYLSGRKKKEIFLYYITDKQVRQIKSLKKKKGIHLAIIGAEQNDTAIRCLTIVVVAGMDPLKLYWMLPDDSRGFTSKTWKFHSIRFYMRGETRNPKQLLENVFIHKGYKVTVGELEK